MKFQFWVTGRRWSWGSIEDLEDCLQEIVYAGQNLFSWIPKHQSSTSSDLFQPLIFSFSPHKKLPLFLLKLNLKNLCEAYCLYFLRALFHFLSLFKNEPKPSTNTADLFGSYKASRFSEFFGIQSRRRSKLLQHFCL